MRRGRFVTIGSFDGVHQGHQVLLQRTIMEAKLRHLRTMAITFKIPPRMVLDQIIHPHLLTDPKEKEFLLRQTGINDVEVLDFNKKFSAIRPFNFFRDVLLRHYRAKGLVVGLDFRFGAERSAGALELVRWGGEFGIPVWVIPPVKFRRAVVSSTLIRHMLRTGNFQLANSYLGRPYLIRGRVVKGQGAGRKLGFPTANVATSPYKILPLGVFVVRGRVEKGKTFEGVCNIGYRPTMRRSENPLVEVHMFNRSGDFKGKVLSVHLLKRLRSEKKFSSVEQLKSAIRRDISAARAYFRKKR